MMTIEMPATCCGKWAAIIVENQMMVGTVIDFVANQPETPKRIRIQRGRLQGQVVQPHEYIFKDWLEDRDIDE